MEMFLPSLKDFDSEAKLPQPKENAVQTIEHPGEVNRIRCCKSNPKMMATQTIEGVINIYERGLDYPVQLLTGQTEEGYALDWRKQGLLSGSYDGQIIIWRDVDKPAIFSGKCKDKVEDTKWVDDNLFLAVTDGGLLYQWDARQKDPLLQFQAHTGDVYTLDVNHSNPNMVLTGGDDHSVRIWDRRCLTKRLYSFEGHNGTVVRVEWSPHDANIFCSGGLDHRVMVWDVLRVGSEVPKDDTNAGPNELLVLVG